MSYPRENIQQLHPYTPGEQPQQARIVKLNTNENPYPPSQAVMDAVAAVSAESLRRYPPPAASTFRAAAAAGHDLSPNQVIATNGGDELLRLALTVFCQPGAHAGATAGGVCVERPTYSLYSVLAAIHDTPVTEVALTDDWDLPEDFAARAIDAGAKMAIIVNPHAPSGRLLSVDRLREVAVALAGRCVLMVDEAYVNFSPADALTLVRDPSINNVLVLRSLSKGYSLAGLRFGYGLGHPDLIRAMDAARDSYNTDALSQAAAVAAITHRDEAAQSWQKVIDQRNRMAAALTERGFHVWPSATNFLLARGDSVDDVQRIFNALKVRGVFVRYFDQDRLRDCLRITIGTSAENDELLHALDEIAAGSR